MKRKRTTAMAVLGAVAMAALVTVTWQQSDLGRAAGDLGRQRAAARREGVPLEWDDVRRLTPPVADADNAVVDYRIGFADLHAAGNMKGVPTDRLLTALADGKAKPEDIEKARAGLLLAGSALGEIATGAAKPGFWMNRRWEQGTALLFPEPSDARSAARALVLRAMLSQDPKAAAADLITAAHLSTHFGSEPILISSFVGISIESNVHTALRYLGRRGGAWTQAMVPVADSFGPLPNLRRTFAGEAAMGNHLTEELAKYGSNAFSPMEGQTPIAFRFSGIKPVRDAFQSRVVEYWRKVYAALPTDPLDLAASRAATSIPVPPGSSQALLDMALPALSPSGEMAARADTQRRLSRVALDLWQGKNPTRPRDPFGKGPLHLRREGKGWTLWSVGEDGIDDGGKPRVKESDRRYDLVVKSGG